MKSLLKRYISERNRVYLKYAFYQISAPLHYGNARTCNLCNKSYKAFLPYGILVQREDACCPGCRSLERTRLLGFFLEREFLPRSKSIKVLHFAPEPPITKLLLKYPQLSYLSVDINPELAMQKEDIHSLSFPDNSFDLVLNSHVLSVIPDDRRALAEIYRVLAPGGTLLLQEEMSTTYMETHELSSDATKADRLSKFGREDLFRDYGTDFSERILHAGFSVDYIDYASVLGEKIKIQFGLNDGQGIFVCTKK